MDSINIVIKSEAFIKKSKQEFTITETLTQFPPL